MIKIFYIILVFFIISSCSFNQVVKHHGVHFLEEKQKSLKVNESNKNDITKLLGIPSTTSKFDNDLWIYIERQKTGSKIYQLGKKKLEKNNVLILEINEMGLLAKKDFLDINQMNELEYTDKVTSSVYSKDSFVYSFLSSMIQRVNDPLGKRRKAK